ncbi:MAG: hypothetical protein LCH37_06900 [Bacteroidetes bacterium]|nr:hypothetical protein [Bacteroidota bacterium]
MIFPDLYFVSNDLSENQRLRSFSKNEILYQDENLKLIVLEADELNQVRLGKRSKTDGSDVISTDKVKYAQFLIVQVIALNSNKEIGEYNIPILYLDCKAEDLYELAFVKSKLNCSHLLLKNKEQDLTLFSKNKLKSKLKSLSARVVFSEKELGEDVLPLENTYVSESVRKRESNSKPKEKVLKRKIRKVEKKMWPNFGRAELYYY